MKPPHAEAGFTLVETLFALVASSLLLIGLGWALRGLEAQLRRSSTASAADQLIAIQPFLENAISHATPLVQGAVLAGTPSALALTVPPPQALGPVGPVRLLLTVEQHDGAADLAARLAPDRPGQALPPEATAKRVLARGFGAIRFEYLRRANDPRDRLPRLISILFRTKQGMLLPLTFAPRLNMGSTCVFDPVSLACRP
jgi:hypothetical protein